MTATEGFISISTDTKGDILLRVADNGGYEVRVKRLLTKEDAYAIAKCIDETCATAYFARNIISDAVRSREQRVKDLRKARERIDKQLAELEK